MTNQGKPTLMPTSTSAAFNQKIADEVRHLHESMEAAGYPMTVAECKFAVVAGYYVAGEMLGCDPEAVEAVKRTAARLAKDLN